MRSIFKRFNVTLPVIVLSLFCAATVGAQGQARDPRVISARAGGVNFVSGEARVKLRDRSHWQTLTTKDTLKTGDTVETGAGSQLEVLLNPGSYLRLGENTEFTLTSDSLSQVHLSLTRGSGLIEATGFTELRVSILVDTPQTRIEIVRSGIYRINVQSAKLTEVAVHKGRALVGKEQVLIKGGRTALVTGGGVEIAKLDKKERDELDLWSRERASMLAKANGKLSTRSVNMVLASFSADDYWRRTGYGFSAGFWYFDTRSGC
ncbi:MAG TPA: FecR family protein, partial [Pyrinomonadaceae bacterium]